MKAVPANNLPSNITNNLTSNMTSNMTSKGQVTIPQALRQSFGFKPGAAVEFFQAGDHVGVRPVQNAAQAPKSGFGMLKVNVKQVPADFDVATLLTQKPSAQNTMHKPLKKSGK